MAEINVDVSLPDPITANVYVAGPEGPRGPAGESPQINNLNGNYLFLTGQDGIYVFDNGINTIYISGNSGYFESKINKLNNNAIFITGDQTINGVKKFSNSGFFAGPIGIGDPLYDFGFSNDQPLLQGLQIDGGTPELRLGGRATDTNKKITFYDDDILRYQINLDNNNPENVNFSGLTSNFSSRPKVNGTGILLSGEIPTLPDTIVYTSGDQNISGIKTFKDGIVIGDSIMPLFLEIKNNTLYVSGGASFVNRPNVNGTGVLLSGEVLGLPETVVYTTGNQTISGIKNFPNGITIIDEESTGSTTLGSLAIDIFDGDQNTVTLSYAGLKSRTEDFTIKTEDFNSLYLGTNNQNRLTITADGNIGISKDDPSEKLEVNGNIKADNLVYNTGNQTILGNKIFDGNTYINNLFVTGTQTIVSTNNFSVQSPFLLLNLTGGAVDGGIFFITGSEFTGLNDFGPIIGFDHSDKFKFGVSTRNSDLSTLNDIASVQEIRTYSGVAADKFSTIINLYNTGSDLNIKIDSLSGDLTRNYITISTLNSTGSILDSKINSLSGSAVSIYGNQDINGVKTFINTGSFNALQINHRKFTSYKISTNNFEINHDYIYLANSENDITGTILMGYYLGQEYSEIPSGINYFIKNINAGKLTITGYTMLPDLHPQPNTIDGFDKLILYKNESVQLIGVNNIGYTGWITISADGGIS
jgi:hypothetical protein